MKQLSHNKHPRNGSSQLSQLPTELEPRIKMNNFIFQNSNFGEEHWQSWCCSLIWHPWSPLHPKTPSTWRPAKHNTQLCWWHTQPSLPVIKELEFYNLSCWLLCTFRSHISHMQSQKTYYIICRITYLLILICQKVAKHGVAKKLHSDNIAHTCYAYSWATTHHHFLNQAVSR